MSARAVSPHPSYEDAIAYLYGLEPRGMRLGLDRMRAALALRGDPHRTGRFVHVAGTNGKGSVAAMVESGLRQAGYVTGLFTSPHLHRFVERIRVAGRPIEPAVVARRVDEIRDSLSVAGAPELTFFETATLLAFECFRDAGCDVVVLEAGLGGRLDSTNVVVPELSVITRLALEHTQRLGSSLGAIAREKAGILKEGAPAVVAVRHPEAKQVITGRASDLGIPVQWIDRDFAAEPVAGSSAVPGPQLVRVKIGARELPLLSCPLAGAHQRDNVATAAASLAALAERRLEIPEAQIVRGLERTAWPGRLERVVGEPTFLLDAAHNPDGCTALAAHLDLLPRRGRRILLFGAMTDKEQGAMLDPFDGRVDGRIYAAPAHLSRAASPAALERVRPGMVAGSVPEAIERAREQAGPEGLVVVAGSIFLMAEVRGRLLGVPADPPIAM